MRWVLEEEPSRAFFRQALEAGINFFDTANVYSLGASEEITGRALKDFAKRDEIVLATKVHGKMRDDPNGRGLSRKAIMGEIDASLKRLGTDYVDLYQTHRWDPETPIEETLEALHDVVKAGKARYIGASSMWAWQFMKALSLQRANGWSRFVSMQNHLNLSTARRSARCCRSAAPRGSGSSRGRRSRAAGLRAPGRISRAPNAAPPTRSARASTSARATPTAPWWKPFRRSRRRGESLPHRWRSPGSCRSLA